MTNGVWLFLCWCSSPSFLLLQGTVVPVFSECAQDAQAHRRAAEQRMRRRSGGPEFTSLLREKYLRELSPLERSLESLPGMERLARI